MQTEVILSIVKRPVEPQVRPAATVAMILGFENPGRQSIPVRGSTATRAARLDSPANPDDSAKFREDIRRRYELPFHSVWNHDGMNLNEEAD